MINSKKKEIIKQEIIKSNNLIESSYRFTLSENRLVDLALTKLETEMLDKNLSAENVKELIKQRNFDEIEINVIDYKKEYNIVSNTVYKEIVESANRLYNRSLIYYDNKELTVKRWVITCVYNKERCSVNIQFHPDLIPDLMIFKGCYTRFDFDIKKYIKSYYTCRIYELLKQYEQFGVRTLDIDYLRFLLGLEDTDYPLYGSFKQRIINPAIKQINEVTDLYCEFEEIKNKKKVEKIRFRFVKQKVNFKNKNKDREQLSLFNDEIALDREENDYNLVKEFRDILGFTISPKQIEKLINISSKSIKEYKKDCSIKEYIKQKKVILDKYLETTPLKKTYLGALISAIQDDWGIANQANHKKVKEGAKDRFNGYENQRDYDTDYLEKGLTGQIKEIEYEKLYKK